MTFNAKCRLCPRLVNFLGQVKDDYPDYHAAPVAPFGDSDARLLVVGLAPGMHGANATGRPFTGDYAGILLYQTLYDYGFSNQPQASSRSDGLELYDCRITNAVKCLPPQNKPIGSEINRCNSFLRDELAGMPERSLILSLGSIAHRAVIKALGLKQNAYPFAHGMEHRLNDRQLMIDSYHCSRYNTQTRRLTPDMFHQVFERARSLLDGR
jgi:uracil-DNA glycosylase family 4